MLKRRLGRTGHMSSVAILGGVAFAEASPEDVVGCPTARDLRLLGAVLAAVENFTPMSPAEIEDEVAGNRLRPLVSLPL